MSISRGARTTGDGRILGIVANTPTSDFDAGDFISVTNNQLNNLWTITL